MPEGPADPDVRRATDLIWLAFMLSYHLCCMKSDTVQKYGPVTDL